MKVTVIAKTGIKARQIAEKEYPEFYYVNSKKISTKMYQVTMNRRKRPMGVIIPNGLWLTRIFDDLLALVKDITPEPTEEQKIVKKINSLYQDIKKLVEE